MSDVEENNFEGRESRSQSKSPTGTPARLNQRAGQDLAIHQEFPSLLNPIPNQDQNLGQGGILIDATLNPGLTLIGDDFKVGPIHQSIGGRGARVTLQCLITEGILPAGQNQILTLAWECLTSVCRQQRERDLREVFSRYGPLNGINVVCDQQTGRSHGFAFVYFEKIDDSKEAMEKSNWMELDGREFVWFILSSPREHTHLHQAVQLMAVVEVAEEKVVEEKVLAVVVVDDEILTMIEDMIEAMTDMKIMITSIVGGLLLTAVTTGHDQDPVPIAQDTIDTGVIVHKDFAFI